MRRFLGRYVLEDELYKNLHAVLGIGARFVHRDSERVFIAAHDGVQQCSDQIVFRLEVIADVPRTKTALRSDATHREGLIALLDKHGQSSVQDLLQPVLAAGIATFAVRYLQWRDFEIQQSGTRF